MPVSYLAKPSKYNVKKNQVGMEKPFILTQVVEAYMKGAKRR